MTMRRTIALASPRVAATFEEGVAAVQRLQSEAAERGAMIVCFPEAYLPGLRGLDFDVYPWDRALQERALAAVASSAREHGIATILGIELITDHGRQIAAAVIGADGELVGMQVKTQLDPSEERNYVPGTGRRLFEIDGLKFGVVICHEGWRYPETVRWAAVRGAHVVFHPQYTGTMRDGVMLTRWGSPEAPYYETAMAMRSRENTIYFASVNYALPFQESATSIIDPSGECVAHLAYGEEGVLVYEIDPDEATGFLARRYAPERFVEHA
jgi:predicted amidohydrolase